MERVIRDDCIFCKIANGVIEVPKVWENDDSFCIADKYPSAPVHLLVIPKSHVDKKNDSLVVGETFWGKFMAATLAVVSQENLDAQGYELVNWGGGYQEIDHEHIHIKSKHK